MSPRLSRGTVVRIERPISPAPKPEPKPAKPRAFSSITPPSHAERVEAAKKQKRTPIRKRNPERIAKREVSYRQKMAAYRKSDCYKHVEARAAGQCEKWVTIGGLARCPNTRGDGYRLHHHHATYARLGGQELQADILVLCKSHHDEVENSLRPWNRRAGRVGGET